MEKNKILDLMVAQHALIEALFSAFKDEVSINPARAKSFLSDLTWEVKKHFFIEEQAIFNLLPWKDQEILEMVAKLKQEHILIVDGLEKSFSDLSLLSGQGGEEFGKLIMGHRQAEEKKLYPLLEERLTPEEKEYILARARQIPLQPI